MTDKENELLENYPEAAAFVGLAASVWNGSNSPAKIEMMVRGKLHAELERLLNKDIQTVFLTDSDIRHIKKKHGSNESARGQIDITPEDFALIPLVLNEFDEVEYELSDKMGNEPLRPEGRSILFALRTLWRVRSVRKLFNCGVYYHGYNVFHTQPP